jgi:DNA-binding NarL/FixJ family response regulator
VFTVSPKFLLIGHQDETLWFRNLANALTTLGELQILPLRAAMQYIRQNKCDMVIIDKSYVKEEILLVSQIRSILPDARIIAITSTPTWQQIRNILKAGAMNYISKSMSEREYFSVFEDTLAKQPPAQRQ